MVAAEGSGGAVPALAGAAGTRSNVVTPSVAELIRSKRFGLPGLIVVVYLVPFISWILNFPPCTTTVFSRYRRRTICFRSGRRRVVFRRIGRDSHADGLVGTKNKVFRPPGGLPFPHDLAVRIGERALKPGDVHPVEGHDANDAANYDHHIENLYLRASSWRVVRFPFPGRVGRAIVTSSRYSIISFEQRKSRLTAFPASQDRSLPPYRLRLQDRQVVRAAVQTRELANPNFET